ncbi:MAG TPA: beta-ketoacyl synthase N-terminal-like domain-containing protein, partial [Mycobacterium sp.]
MEPKHPAVAVVGVSALFPGSPEAERFWRNIVDGVDLFSEVPESHWRADDYYDSAPNTPDKVYVTRGGFLPEVDFSPIEFGIPPNVVPATDTAQLLALRVAQQVLEDAAGGDFSEMDRERVSVVIGSSGGTELLTYMAGRLHRPVWERGLRAAGLSESELTAFSDHVISGYTPWQENTFPGLLGNVIAGRIANRFDLGGTNCVIDAACASSLAALEVGLHELYLGESDMVIAGGVDAFNDIFMFMCFAKVTALSPSGDCRPFSDRSDGTMLGEGLAMFALKRLDDAERDGDQIYAVIRGIGTSSDGRAKSIYAPSPAGQAKALRRAYAAAGYGPETVGLVEAHGTGTKAGDAAEFAALREVFAASGRADQQWCALGSVKSQVGHTKGAAGACGLFKAVMALHHKVLPPTIKIDQPNLALDLESSPFYLPAQ